MYQPKLDDVRFTHYVPYEGKLLAHALIYLKDNENRSFGYRSSTKLDAAASYEQKKQGLEQAASKLIKEFDVEKSAKNQNFDGDLSSLTSLAIPDTYTLDEALSS